LSVAGWVNLLINSIIEDASLFFFSSGFLLAHSVHESDREESEGQKEDDVQNKCPNDDCSFFFGICFGSSDVEWSANRHDGSNVVCSANRLDVSNVSGDKRIWAVWEWCDGVLYVDEFSSVYFESLLFSAQINLLSSAKVVVQKFECSEGMEHFLSVSSNLLGAQGIPREEVVDTTAITGW